MQSTNTDILIIAVFFVLMGVVFVGIQMTYNSAMEYRHMMETCSEYGLVPTENGTLYQLPKRPQGQIVSPYSYSEDKKNSPTLSDED